MQGTSITIITMKKNFQVQYNIQYRNTPCPLTIAIVSQYAKSVYIFSKASSIMSLFIMN